MHHEQLETEINLLHAADHRGRPIAILRIGGRIPVGWPLPERNAVVKVCLKWFFLCHEGWGYGS